MLEGCQRNVHGSESRQPFMGDIYKICRE